MAIEILSDGSKIIRLDDHRSKKLGQMVVVDAPAYDTNPFACLLDLGELDGKQLLEDDAARQASYTTAPFDPDGHMLRFYPGGITIWSGFPGSGKTTILRQLVCHLLHRGAEVFMASLEEHPRDALVRLATVASGQYPNAHQMQWFIDAYHEKFRIWGALGLAPHKKLLGVARTLAAIGTGHVIIDSLMCLDVPNDDLEGQRKFANAVSATARAAKIHIHLVAHPRKPQKSDQAVSLSDIAGAREIGGIADNVLFVRRNVGEDYTANAAVTPMGIEVCKQRYFNGALGEIRGYFNREMKQFTTNQWPEHPHRYLPDDAYA